MKKIGIIGYGELGKQFENLLLNNDKSLIFFYFDDEAFKSGLNNSHPFRCYLDPKFKELSFCIGLGYKHLQLKNEILNSLINNSRKLHTFIHPSAVIDSTAKIEGGSFIYPNVTIDKNVHIAYGCLINLSCTVAHDTNIGNSSFLGPSVTISGFVEVGEMVFIGTGACIANNLTIKNNSTIGIGTVVTKNILENEYVIGNPQKTVKKISLK